MTQTTTTRKPARKPRTLTDAEREARKAASYAAHKALADQLTAFSSSLDEAEQEAYAARFDKYSALNALRIVMQKPDATVVLGFAAWIALGRCPRKGTGLQILAPHGRRKGAADAKPTSGEATAEGEFGGCHITNVFDVSDTYELEEKPKAA